MWQSAKATFLRNQKSDLRSYPWSFAFGYIVDGVYVILISWLFYHYLIEGQLDGRFRQYSGTADYLTYAVIGGMLAQISVMMMMNVSRALITEYREGTLEALLLAPSSRMGYLIGITFQQFFRVALEMVPILAVGIWVGLRVPQADFLSALLGALLYFGACFSMGLVLGSVMLHTRNTYIVQNTLFVATSLLCGFQFPRAYMPEALQWAGEVFPLTGALNMLRQALLSGVPIWSDPSSLCVTLLLIFLYGMVGFALIKRTERTVLTKLK